MSFASYARFARCRNAHCSSWARNLNINLGLHQRGLASAPLLRLAAEMRPPAGWVEQRIAAQSVTSRLCIGEGLDDVTGAASAQAVAAILHGIAEMDSAISNSFTEMLDLCGHRYRPSATSPQA
ncbi:unnamed protein product [Polarella glacialis]|nr:unnamed protein product [Polarella glacialis]